MRGIEYMDEEAKLRWAVDQINEGRRQGAEWARRHMRSKQLEKLVEINKDKDLRRSDDEILYMLVHVRLGGRWSDRLSDTIWGQLGFISPPSDWYVIFFVVGAADCFEQVVQNGCELPESWIAVV